MILAGHSSKNIARLLGISPATAKVHRSNLYRKLEISSQATLFRIFMGGAIVSRATRALLSDKAAAARIDLY